MVGIIILNYINWEVSYKCVNSILKSTNNINYHIYIIDNASPNECPEKIMSLFKLNPQITFIKSNENNGYSAGNNIGIKEALKDNCNQILISNSDIVFLNDSILLMKETLKEKSIGIVGPKLIGIDGKTQQPSMCIKTRLKEKYLARTFLRHIFKGTDNKYNCRDLDLGKPAIVHSVSGSCFMMSKECALEITPFDENTFLFQEELIIGIQMEKKGLKTMYNPLCEVIHEHGQSTKSIKALSFIFFVESEIYYCRKYLNASLISILPLYSIRSISFMVRCINNKDFRENISKYITKTGKKLLAI